MILRLSRFAHVVCVCGILQRPMSVSYSFDKNTPTVYE